MGCGCGKKTKPQRSQQRLQAAKAKRVADAIPAKDYVNSLKTTPK